MNCALTAVEASTMACLNMKRSKLSQPASLARTTSSKCAYAAAISGTSRSTRQSTNFASGQCRLTDSASVIALGR